MSERIGVCGGCGMKFKVPDTFQGSQAKCKKCGGVVTISDGSAAAPAAAKPAIAPKAAAAKPGAMVRPSAAKSASAPAPAAGKAGSSRTAGRASKAGASGAGKRGAPAPKKDNTMMIVGIAAAVIIVGGGAFFMTQDDKKPSELTVTAAPPADASKVETPPPEPVAETPIVDPVATEPAPPVEAPKPPEPEPAPTEELPSVIDFPAFEKPSVITDEQWTAAQDAVRIAFIESSRPKQRGEAMKVLNEQPVAAIGAMINGMIGLDLAQDKTFITAGQIVKGIQTVSFDVVKIPFKLDILEMVENVQFNAKCVQNLKKYWAKEMASAEKFAAKIQAARDKPPEDLDDN